MNHADLFSLAGKVAIVTGGSRGLGRSIALAYARAGADVVVASRKIESCIEAADAIERETGRRPLPTACHVGRWNEHEQLMAVTLETFGRLDVLVNNAGMSPVYDDPATISEALFDKVVDVNLKGPFRLAVLAGDHMHRHDGGSIINISSTGAVHPRREILPYAAAKAGLNALTIGLARTYGPTVRCNAIMPGTFRTDVAKAWDEEQFAARAQSFALRRGGEPDEIVGAALYLASEASSYTTGAILTVDGGQP